MACAPALATILRRPNPWFKGDDPFQDKPVAAVVLIRFGLRQRREQDSVLAD